MCGINAIISHKSPPSSVAAIRKMNRAVEHRGPDQSTALAVAPWATLGINRLEIVGGSRGSQPIPNEDKTIWLVCNGEIYNHAELKKKHLARHRFATTSDVEVILHLYEEFGPDIAHLLEGQFAYVIVDTKKNMTFIARDPFGILPIFFAQNRTQFLISSEMKGLAASGLLPKLTLNRSQLLHAWALYGATPPQTIFHEISQLPPGYSASYAFATGTFAMKRYWSIPLTVSAQKMKSKASRLTTLLTQSVSRRLQGAYRPGVYISGGVDSSIIASLVSKLAPVKPLLFGITFASKLHDERHFQTLLAKHLACEFIKVHITPQDLEDNFEACVRQVETPIIRSAPIPMLLLSKLVRKRGVKFILSGEGSDELFLGYPVFARGISSIEDKWETKQLFLPFFRDISFLKDELVGAYRSLTSNENKNDTIDRIRLTEMDTKLSRYLLVTQGDRVSMANSVEQRFPYLDREIVTFAMRQVRDNLSLGSQGKIILRQAFRHMLPKTLIDRPKKGYLTPDIALARLLVKHKKNTQLFSKSTTQTAGIFDQAMVEKLVQKAQSPKIMLTDEEARFILFIASTHIIYNTFCAHAYAT